MLLMLLMSLVMLMLLILLMMSMLLMMLMLLMLLMCYCTVVSFIVVLPPGRINMPVQTVVYGKQGHISSSEECTQDVNFKKNHPIFQEKNILFFKKE